MAATVEHKCEHCRYASPQVMYDAGLRRWLCHWCWVRTPLPRGDSRRPDDGYGCVGR